MLKQSVAPSRAASTQAHKQATTTEVGAPSANEIEKPAALSWAHDHTFLNRKVTSDTLPYHAYTTRVTPPSAVESHSKQIHAHT